ncbi:MAG: hypothetical protein ACKVP4_10205 [Hyphomicrobium sp.]
MDNPSPLRESPQGIGAIVFGVAAIFLTIIAFGVIASRIVIGDREVVQVAPAVAPATPSATTGQPGVPPAAVKPDDKPTNPAVTAPASQQPADAVNPGKGDMPEPKPSGKPPTSP